MPKTKGAPESDEAIVWNGKPRFVPFVLRGAWSGLVGISFALVWILVSKSIDANDHTNKYSYTWLIGLIPPIAGLFIFLRKVLTFFYTTYSFTGKGILIRSGFIRPRVKTISYDKISAIEVTVSYLEKICKTGTIRFFSGNMLDDEGGTIKIYDRWIAIENYQEVFGLVMQTSVKHKAEIAAI